MSGNGGGRPTRTEQKRREAQFLCAIADHGDATKAAKDARLNPWRALTIVNEAGFRDVVRAIRDEGVGPVAVVVETAEAKAA